MTHLSRPPELQSSMTLLLLVLKFVSHLNFVVVSFSVSRHSTTFSRCSFFLSRCSECLRPRRIVGEFQPFSRFAKRVGSRSEACSRSRTLRLRSRGLFLRGSKPQVVAK